jgi:anti-sigma regulatory factor (Ser/Thr protein kinase)
VRRPTQLRLAVTDPADVGAARRAVAAVAERASAPLSQRGRAELAVTELASNLLRHAKPGGWILTRPVEPSAVEIISVDQGPGIDDVSAALDGQSTMRKGLGCGLAAVRRAASRFDMYTRPGYGTTVLAIVELGTEAAPEQDWAGVSVGLTEACGDGWSVFDVGDRRAVAVVDGLGHGIYASAAADAALRAFAVDPVDLETLVARANAAVRGTRGAAMLACRMSPATESLYCVGVGNVAGRIVAGTQTRGLVSTNGTLGLRMTAPTARVSSYPMPPGATLLLWTDGLSARIDLAEHPNLFDHHPAVIAATLHRRYTRDRDDATMVVVRNPCPR